MDGRAVMAMSDFFFFRYKTTFLVVVNKMKTCDEIDFNFRTFIHETTWLSRTQRERPPVVIITLDNQRLCRIETDHTSASPHFSQPWMTQMLFRVQRRENAHLHLAEKKKAHFQDTFRAERAKQTRWMYFWSLDSVKSRFRKDRINFSVCSHSWDCSVGTKTSVHLAIDQKKMKIQQQQRGKITLVDILAAWKKTKKERKSCGDCQGISWW